VTATYLDSVGS